MLRLIRPVNILLLFVFMQGFILYLNEWYSVKGVENWALELPIQGLVFSLLLVAASGNVINDFYDIEADKINKPNRVVVEKSFSKKSVLIFYFGLVFFTVFLGIITKIPVDFMIVLGVMIFLLWLYSYKLKKILLLGNLVIAGLTASIPILLSTYFYSTYEVHNNLSVYPFEDIQNSNFILYLGFGFGLFSFGLNLAREIIKDIEDKEGDRVMNVRSLPLVLGEKSAQNIVFGILCSLLIFTIYLFIILFSNSHLISGWLLLILTVLIVVWILFKLVKPLDQKGVENTSLLLKVAISFGTLLPIYWLIYIHLF